MTTRTPRERGEGRATAAPRPTVAMAPPLAAVSGSESPRLVQAQSRSGAAAGAADAAVDFEARCAQLEDENRRLKLLVADLSLRNEALKLVVAKKW